MLAAHGTPRRAFSTARGTLSLGELDAAASATEAVLLAFLHAGIAGEVALAAERGEGFAIEGEQGAGDAHFAGEGLAIGAAAGAGDDDIDLVALAGDIEGIDDGL